MVDCRLVLPFTSLISWSGLSGCVRNSEGQPQTSRERLVRQTFRTKTTSPYAKANITSHKWSSVVSVKATNGFSRRVLKIHFASCAGLQRRLESVGTSFVSAKNKMLSVLTGSSLLCSSGLMSKKCTPSSRTRLATKPACLIDMDNPLNCYAND